MTTPDLWLGLLEIVGYLFLIPLGIVVPLWFAMKFPALRVKIGAIVVLATIVLAIYIPRWGSDSSLFAVWTAILVLIGGLILGASIMVWGFASRKR